MLKSKLTSLVGFAGAVAVLLIFASAPAGAFTMTFNKSGSCSSTVGTCSSTTGPDPFGLTAGNVLIFTLPQLTFTASINIFDPGDVTISDRMTWYCSAGPGNCGSVTINDQTFLLSDKMIFYSFDSNGAAADVALISGVTIPSTTLFTTENADGSFVWVVPPPGTNIYDGKSDTPLPAALPLFATGLGALGLLGWRRKRKIALSQPPDQNI